MRKALLLILLCCAGLAHAQVPTPTGAARVRVSEGNNFWFATLNELLSGRIGPDSTWSKTAGGYANRRITDAVYRFAPFGVGSTDTTGRINLLGVGTTKPGIYARYLDASTNGYNFFRVDPDAQTNNSSLGSFTFWATNFDGVNSPYSTRANHVWRMGYNSGAGGGREVAADADLHIAFESNFYNFYTTGRRKRSWEWHLQSQDTLDGVHRMISAIGSHDGKDGEISFATNRFTLNPYSISGPWLGMDYVAKNTYIDTMRFYFNTPQIGYPFFSFRNVANSAYIKMFEQGSSDELIISSQGNITQLGGVLKMPSAGVIYTLDNSPLNIGNSSNKTGLTVFSNSDDVLTLKSANETGGWKFRAEATDFVLMNPSGNSPLYMNETAPHTSVYVEATTGDVGLQITNPTARIHTYTTSGATYPGFRQENSTGNSALYRSNASPDGAITANPGDIAQTGISSLGGLWVKETGTGNTGWAKTLTGWQVTKAVPTTSNATQEVGVITHNDGGRSTLVQIDAVVAASGFAMQKRYVVPLGFNSTGGSWNILVPTESSENSSWAGTNNFNLEMRTNTSGSPSGGIDTIRITRIAGSTAANCVITIQVLSAGASTSFTSTSGTGTSSTTTLYAQQAIAQINNKVGVNNIAPARTLHVTGEVRITDLTTDPPTDILGTDADGDLGILARSAELTIASGTLKLAQQGATSGQVLEWNGSAWAPGTDDGGAGSGYATLRDDGVAATQRTIANFVSTATVTATLTDDAGNTETEIALNVPTDGIGPTELAPTAVSAGSYVRASVTIDADGRATAAANGVLRDDGSDATNRANMNFVSGLNGSAVLTDDAGNTETEIKVDVLAGSISPSQITSDQDNYTPTNWSTNTTARISGDATIRAITSFAALPDGTVRRLVNIGTTALYIPMEHPDGTAANRVTGPCDQILAPYGGVITMYYDGTSTRWRIEYNSFNVAAMQIAGMLGHYYTASAGATVAGDWGDLNLVTSGGANGQVAPTSTLPGAWEINTSTSATGMASLAYSDGVVNPVEIGSAHIVASCAVYFPTLSDGTQTYTFQMGIIPSPTSTTLNVNNSVGIRYTNGTNSGKWQGFSRDNAGSESTADLGTTVATNTNYVLTVRINKARDEAYFYINGAYAGRVTGNMPSATDAGMRVGIFKSVGTTSRAAEVASLQFFTVY